MNKDLSWGVIWDIHRTFAYKRWAIPECNYVFQFKCHEHSVNAIKHNDRIITCITTFLYLQTGCSLLSLSLPVFLFPPSLSLSLSLSLSVSLSLSLCCPSCHKAICLHVKESEKWTPCAQKQRRPTTKKTCRTSVVMRNSTTSQTICCIYRTMNVPNHSLTSSQTTSTKRSSVFAPLYKRHIPVLSTVLCAHIALTLTASCQASWQSHERKSHNY